MIGSLIVIGGSLWLIYTVIEELVFSSRVLVYLSGMNVFQLLQRCEFARRQFRPTPYLNSCFLQSLWHWALCTVEGLAQRLYPVEYERELIEMPDGATFSLDWAFPPSPDHAQGTAQNGEEEEGGGERGGDDNQSAHDVGEDPRQPQNISTEQNSQEASSSSSQIRKRHVAVPSSSSSSSSSAERGAAGVGLSVREDSQEEGAERKDATEKNEKRGKEFSMRRLLAECKILLHSLREKLKRILGVCFKSRLFFSLFQGKKRNGGKKSKKKRKKFLRPPTNTVVLVVTGTPLGSEEPHVKAFAHEAVSWGHTVAVLNGRGCAGTPLTSPVLGPPVVCPQLPCWCCSARGEDLGTSNERVWMAGEPAESEAQAPRGPPVGAQGAGGNGSGGSSQPVEGGGDGRNGAPVVREEVEEKEKERPVFPVSCPLTSDLNKTLEHLQKGRLCKPTEQRLVAVGFGRGGTCLLACLSERERSGGVQGPITAAVSVCAPLSKRPNGLEERAFEEICIEAAKKRKAHRIERERKVRKLRENSMGGRLGSIRRRVDRGSRVCWRGWREISKSIRQVFSVRGVRGVVLFVCVLLGRVVTAIFLKDLLGVARRGFKFLALQALQLCLKLALFVASLLAATGLPLSSSPAGRAWAGAWWESRMAAQTAELALNNEEMLRTRQAPPLSPLQSPSSIPPPPAAPAPTAQANGAPVSLSPRRASALSASAPLQSDGMAGGVGVNGRSSQSSDLRIQKLTPAVAALSSQNRAEKDKEKEKTYPSPPPSAGDPPAPAWHRESLSRPSSTSPDRERATMPGTPGGSHTEPQRDKPRAAVSTTSSQAQAPHKERERTEREERNAREQSSPKPRKFRGGSSVLWGFLRESQRWGEAESALWGVRQKWDGRSQWQLPLDRAEDLDEVHLVCLCGRAERERRRKGGSMGSGGAGSEWGGRRSAELLGDCGISLLLLHSREDPLVESTGLDLLAVSGNRNLAIALVNTGGHLSAFTGLIPRFWFSRAALEFLHAASQPLCMPYDSGTHYKQN
uniref:Uncharacterized protein n=1 Tax=Chromera velia CCMP2878 TaxID=1169474 RepID=A0A0G4F8P2_9ALVE|eukprot:Cvel_15657.t1-p1 / transcript=Cvel_15657.t1 / gene=Cvel_15657 / organism=Chromera_velia_CCMP2878 / gene_product=hypothetical protein / transcript_product=hypothetical protein / location=Cvel_scaffold1168:42636-47199(-) / protein_length=1025 / sequence_SO=supercontig / SO=protein_coding / is_pseudo=false